MSPTELENTKRIAVKLREMRKQLKCIQTEASSLKDKSDVLGAGRRLERIHMAASEGLAAYNADE